MVVNIFTDGSCLGTRSYGGWASVFSFEDGIREISGQEYGTTSNRMELTAIIKTYERILKLGNRSKNGRMIEYVIHSDSAYCVNAINQKWWMSWVRNKWITASGSPVKNSDLWEKWLYLSEKARRRNISVTLKKVKGHAGNPLNERADRLAVRESTNLKAWMELG